MASKPTNLQAAIDMLQKPADVGSISPIGINDKFTPELSRDPVLRKLQQFFRIAKNEVNNPLNYLAGAGAIGKVDKARKAAGIGHNKGPSIFGAGSGTVVSDDVARQIFKADEEMEALKVLNKRKDRLEYLTTVYYDKIPAKKLNQLEKEYEILGDKIRYLESDIKDKVVRRFDKNLQSRTIDELDPARVGRIGMQDLLNATVGEKNKKIINKLGRYDDGKSRLDSPGVDFEDSRYGTNKFSEGIGRYSPYSISKPIKSKYDFERDFPDAKPEEIREMMFSPKAYKELINPTSKTKVDKEGIATLLNPLEKFEKGRYTSQTFQIGGDTNPLFVDPKKLANKLDKSASGEDFFKLRTNEKDYLDMLEKSIKKKGYKPSPIDIVVQPSGNTVISEGNHRLYRALSKGDAEVPIQIRYEAGAERLDTPFGISDIDSLLADGQKGIKNAKEFKKYINEVNKTYRIKKATGGEANNLQAAIDLLNNPVTSSISPLGDPTLSPLMESLQKNPIDDFAMMMADPTKVGLKVINTPIKMQLKKLFAKRNKIRQLIDKQKFNYDRGLDLASKADPRDIAQGNFQVHVALKSGKRFQKQLNTIEEDIRKLYKNK
jgi:hypothetical protein